MHIADAAVAPHDAVLHVQLTAALEHGLLCLDQARQVVGMHARGERGEGAGEFARFDPEDLVDLRRPLQLAVDQVQFPGAHPRDLLRPLQAVAGVEQGARLRVGLGDVARHREQQALGWRPGHRQLHHHHAAVAAQETAAEIVGGLAADHGRQLFQAGLAVVRVREIHQRPSHHVVGVLAPDAATGLAHLDEAAVGIEHADHVQRVVHHQPPHGQRLFQAARELALRLFGALALGDVLQRQRRRRGLARGVPRQRAQLAHHPYLAVGGHHAVLDVQVAFAGVQGAIGLPEPRAIVEVHALEQRRQAARGLRRRQAEDAQRLVRHQHLAAGEVVFAASQPRQPLGAVGRRLRPQHRLLLRLALGDVLEIDRQPRLGRIGAHAEPATQRREMHLEPGRLAQVHRHAVLALHVGADGVRENRPQSFADQVGGLALHQLFGA